MQIGNNIIPIPHEDATQYAADWRHLVAKGWRDNMLATFSYKVKMDKGVLRQRDFLGKIVNPQDAWLPEQKNDAIESLAFNIYMGANRNNMRLYLEPLLLTNEPYSTIALDLNIPVAAVECYERTYFNCRTPDGKLCPSSLLRIRLALGVENKLAPNTAESVMWRAIAAWFGYSVLVYMWRWDTAHGNTKSLSYILDKLMHITAATMVDKALRGSLDVIDINAFMGQYINHKRLQHDTGAATAGDDSKKALLAILEHMAPRMIDIGKRNEALAVGNSDAPVAVAALAAQIQGTKILDNGPEAATARLNLTLQNKLSDVTMKVSKPPSLPDREGNPT